jgi:hypothetical protein
MCRVVGILLFLPETLRSDTIVRNAAQALQMLEEFSVQISHLGRTPLAQCGDREPRCVIAGVIATSKLKAWYACSVRRLFLGRDKTAVYDLSLTKGWASRCQSKAPSGASILLMIIKRPILDDLVPRSLILSI